MIAYPIGLGLLNLRRDAAGPLDRGESPNANAVIIELRLTLLTELALAFSRVVHSKPTHLFDFEQFDFEGQELIGTDVAISLFPVS